MRKPRTRPRDLVRRMGAGVRDGLPDALVAERLPLRETPVPRQLTTGPQSFPEGEYIRTYTIGECTVIVSRERGRWHLSIAHRHRNPTWEEISQARYRILPDAAWMAMLLPPRNEYVNANPHCFQMVEIDPMPGGDPP